MNAEIKRNIRDRWISSLFEIAHSEFQNRLWINADYKNSVGDYNECVCGYFDDLDLESGYSDFIANGIISEPEYKIVKELHSGKLVPVKLISELIKEKLIGIENGLLISGYPRTKEQLESLIEIFTEFGVKINRLWILELQNIEKLISEYGNNNTHEQIIEKFNSTKRQNKQIAELINNPKIISKIDFNYPVDWTCEQMRNKIKAVCNNC